MQCFLTCITFVGMSKAGHKYKVGISVGDINGIGLEVIIKTFLDNAMFEYCTPIVYCSLKAANFYRKQLNVHDFSFLIIKSASEANPKRLNLIELPSNPLVQFGELTKEAGMHAFKSLEMAVQDLASNNIDILVTAPINKDNIQSEEFNFPGHTEYLANYANEDNPLMLLVHNNLRVGVATGHIPISKVSTSLNSDLILKRLEVMNKSLSQDFLITRPKIAVLGLNPHAGDNGLMGDEEKEVIIPAMQQAQKQGMLVFGPFPADGFFGSDMFKKYDGVLAMYHDQGLAPFKAISFDEGVNYTAGLPIVRTSSDHGTAFDIAGKGEANENSFRQAVFLACDVFTNRKLHKEITANPLKNQQVHESDK